MSVEEAERQREETEQWWRERLKENMGKTTVGSLYGKTRLQIFREMVNES